MTFDEIPIQQLAGLLAKGDQLLENYTSPQKEIPGATRVYLSMISAWKSRTGRDWSSVPKQLRFN